MSESFFVLSGRIQLFDGREWTVGEQGDYLYVPPGGIHGFGNQSDEPASILMLFAPGAPPREFYFEGVAQARRADRRRTSRVLRSQRQFLGLTTRRIEVRGRICLH